MTKKIRLQRPICFGMFLLVAYFASTTGYCQRPHFNVLAFYSTNVEKDHVIFAEEAMQFYSKLAKTGMISTRPD
jgi:hypothetical protein